MIVTKNAKNIKININKLTKYKSYKKFVKFVLKKRIFIIDERVF